MLTIHDQLEFTLWKSNRLKRMAYYYFGFQ